MGLSLVMGPLLPATGLHAPFVLMLPCLPANRSFAHGSNDVANAVGPFAGIYAVWQCTCVSSKSDVPIWCGAR